MHALLVYRCCLLPMRTRACIVIYPYAFILCMYHVYSYFMLLFRMRIRALLRLNVSKDWRYIERYHFIAHCWKVSAICDMLDTDDFEWVLLSLDNILGKQSHSILPKDTQKLLKIIQSHKVIDRRCIEVSIFEFGSGNFENREYTFDPLLFRSSPRFLKLS